MFFYTGVWNDFHIRWCSCRLIVIRRISYVEEELLALPERLSSPRFLVGFALLYLILCVMFCLSLWPLHCIVCPPIYVFWLPFDYLLITFWLPSDYLLITFCLPFDYLLVTLWLPSDYLLITFWLRFDYLLVIFWLPSDYLSITFWLPFRHLQTFLGIYLINKRNMYGIFTVDVSFKYGQLSFLINEPLSKQANSLSVKIASINHVLRSLRT
jgi:hypothetical protein